MNSKNQNKTKNLNHVKNYIQDLKTENPWCSQMFGCSFTLLSAQGGELGMNVLQYMNVIPNTMNFHIFSEHSRVTKNHLPLSKLFFLCLQALNSVTSHR